MPETPKGDYAEYILDGQQRITSLYAIRKGIRITKDGKHIDYKDIFIDLNNVTENDDQIVVTEKIDERVYVSVHDVLSQPLGVFYKMLTNEQADKIEYYKTKLTNYDFSTITIKDYPIEVACEVFSRINTSGRALSIFEIMVAKTYDEEKNFDLAEEYRLLRDGSDENKICLEEAGFGTIPESVIMQCVAVVTKGAVRGKDILTIPRNNFIENWDGMKAALFSAIDFIRHELRIPVSQLLPYPALLIPLTYFFYKVKNKKPSFSQTRMLEQFFYWVGLTARYTSASDSKLGEDLNKMDKIYREEAPTYSRNEMEVTATIISQTFFSIANSYCKSILCLFAYQQPKSFDTNGSVTLDNSNLKISSSRNYHHFFPKQYLAESNFNKDSNLIANITLIDAFSNKKIGKKAPSIYINGFGATNIRLAETLKTHLISDATVYGVHMDDYDKFIESRAIAIAEALNEKLNPVIGGLHPR